MTIFKNYRCSQTAEWGYTLIDLVLLTQDPLALAMAFFEQFSHVPFKAVTRFINKYLGLTE